MTDRIKQNSFLVFLLVLVFLGMLFMQDKIAIKRFYREAPAALLYLPPAEIAPTLALGYDAMWADLNWIRLLQYFGGLYLTTRDYPQIERIFEVIFALDPYFKDAYLFSSLAVGEEVGRPERALEFLEKGMKHMPDDWQLPFDAGFLAMQTMQDYDLAKEYFQRATETPHCPSYVYRIIPFLETEAGRYEAALFYYQEGIQRAIENNDEVSQAIYRQKIKETLNTIHLRQLNQGLESFIEKEGKVPEDLDVLVEKQYVQEIPAEPFGGYYYIDPSEKVASSTDNKNFIQRYLSAIRRELRMYYQRNEEYPEELDDLGPELLDEPFWGEWVYNPETGEVHSSTHPEL